MSRTSVRFAGLLLTLFLYLDAQGGVVPLDQRSTKPTVDVEAAIAPSRIIDLSGTWEMTGTGQDSVFGPESDGMKNSARPGEDATWKKVQIPGKDFAGWVSWYRRTIDVPADWTGKRVTVRFKKTHYKTDVYWNGQLVHVQIDTAYSYDVDVSTQIKPGETNELLVGVVKYPVYRGEGPVDYIENQYRGISMPVALAVSDPLSVADVFAKPSVNGGKLDLEVTIDFLRNASTKPRDVTLVAWVKDNGRTVKRFAPKALSLAPGETKAVELTVPWPDAELWWTHRPYLYHAGVEIRENGKCIGGRVVRFGFREFQIKKHLITMSGKNLFLRRKSLLVYRDWLNGSYARKTLATFRRRGYNAVRTHFFPHDYINEVADEEGFLVFCEMPIKGKNLPEDSQSLTWRLTVEHVKGVVREGRNHPSVLMWNICNEITYYSKDKLDLQIRRLHELGDIATSLDPTRTVHYDGDKDLDGGAPTASLHYPWQIFKPTRIMPATSYWLSERRTPWMGWVWQKDKPLSIGEYFFPPYSLRYPHGVSQFAGDRAYVDPDGWIEAGLQAYKWINEGYAHAQVFSIDPWNVSTRMYDTGPVVRPIILAIRQKQTTFFSREQVHRTFYVYNYTLVDRNFNLRIRLADGDETVFAKDIAIELIGGEMSEQEVTIPLPAVAAKEEYRFTAQLFEGDRQATDGESSVWSVFARPTKKDWPNGDISVLVDDDKLLSGLRETGMSTSVCKTAADAAASGAKLILVYGKKLDEQQGRALTEYVAGGGRVVITNVPNGSWLPGQAVIAGSGNHAAAHAFKVVASHPALNGLVPSDLCIWRPDTYVCRNTFAKPAGKALIVLLDAGGTAGMKWSPLMELQIGSGRFILNQMLVTERLGIEPAAGELLKNLVAAAMRPVKNTSGRLAVCSPPDGKIASVMDQIAVRAGKLATSKVAIIDGALPADAMQKVLAECKGKRGTIILHALTPESAAIAADVLGVPIVLIEKELSHIVRTGRHPIIDGLSNDDFFWMTGQFDISWPQFRAKPTATICQFVLDTDLSSGWRTLTDPAALSVWEKGGRRIVLDQIRWDHAVDAERTRCQRIAGSLLANLGVAVGDTTASSVRKLVFVDLRKVTNRGFVDEVKGDGTGGWTDGGPEWDMRFFPVNQVGLDRHGMGCPKERFPSVSNMGGCQFMMIDPQNNAGRACLVMGKGKGLPTDAGPIAIGKPARAVWFLHAAEIGWNAVKPTTIATATITYTDGTRADAEMNNLMAAGDWRAAPAVRLGDFAWQGYCVRHDPVAVYVYRWQNPHPDKTIAAMSLSAGKDATYILIAMTLER